MLAAGLVGSLVLTHQLSTDATALGHLNAVFFRPGAYRRAVNPRSGGPTLTAAIPASAYPPTGFDIRGDVTFQPGAIISTQVDLVRHAVQTESHGLRIRRSVEIIRNHDRHASRHNAYRPGTSGRCQNNARVSVGEPPHRLWSLLPADPGMRGERACRGGKA